MATIGATAMAEVTSFKNTNIQTTEGRSFNQYKTIQKIIRYTRSEYDDRTNNGELFYNIGNQRIPLYAKSIDSDTKDFYVTGIGKTNWFKQWAINVRYRRWAREEGFAQILNDNSNSIATFGSTVWKKTYNKKGEVEIQEVPLQNLYFDPTVKNIIESPVVELHYLTALQLRAKYPEKAEEAIKKAEEARDDKGHTSETTTKKYMVWERVGEFDNKYMHVIGIGAGDGEVHLNEKELKINNDGEIEDFPYYDLHGERVKGRWLGLGVVERLFPIQKQVNKLVNQNDEANNIASLLLFRSADPSFNGNITEGLSSGDVLTSEDFQEINISNRFLQGFLLQLRELENKADKLCYIQESISGERPPSGVPFRSVALASRGAVSTFTYIKQHIVEKMGAVLIKEFFPELIKKFNKEDVLRISEDETDVSKYMEMVVEQAIKDYKIQRAKEGSVVFEEDLAALAEHTLKGLEENKDYPIGKKFFDFEYGIIMNPSNEMEDKAVMNQSIDSAIEYMISAPAVVNTPIFQQKLANNNIPPFRLTANQKQSLEQTSGGIPQPEPKQDNLSQQAAV